MTQLNADRRKKSLEPVYQAFGARIRMIRTALGLSCAELATKLNLTRASVNNIELGAQRVLLDDVEKFAEVLGTTPKGPDEGDLVVRGESGNGGMFEV